MVALQSMKICGKGGRRKTLKRILSYALSALMLCGLLGCTPGGNNRVKLVWVVPGEKKSNFAQVEEKINRITKEKIGVNVKFEFVPSSYGSRVNAKIEAGEDIDLCFTGYLDSYEARVYDNKLVELDELLKETPKLKKSVPEYLWDGARVKGKIYAVPNEQITSVSTALVVSRDLADKYGYDLSGIRSTYDIEPFLKLLKENEPNMYPIRVNWGLNGFGSIDDNKFTEASIGGVMIVNENGKISTELITESAEKLKAAKTLSEWYKKGYIRRDVAIAMDSAEDLAAGKYGVWFETYKPGVEWQRKLMTGNNVYAVQVSKPYLSTSAMQSAMTGISISSKYPKQSLKLLELVNTEPEILNLLTYGIEGENYRKTADNVVERTENVFSNSTWLFGNQFIVYTERNHDEDIWEKTKQINESSEKSPLIGFSADTSNIKQEIIKCNETVSKYNVCNNGTEDPDTYWADFDRELKQSGAEKIRRELEKQINKFLKNKNID